MAPVGRIKLPNQPPLTRLCRLEICVLARVSEGVGSVPLPLPMLVLISISPAAYVGLSP